MLLRTYKTHIATETGLAWCSEMRSILAAYSAHRTTKQAVKTRTIYTEILHHSLWKIQKEIFSKAASAMKNEKPHFTYTFDEIQLEIIRQFDPDRALILQHEKKLLS